ncbi:hypothetical protein BH24DEI1_BH24DEI1_05870 [soil metagenome]
MADRVVVMNRGRIEQLGTPEEVYDHPASPFVYEFLGDVNRLSRGVHSGVPGEVSYVRPHDLEVSRHSAHPEAVRAVIDHIVPIGPTVRLELRHADDDSTIEAEMSKDHYRSLNLAEGQQIFVTPRRHKVFTPA